MIDQNNENKLIEGEDYYITPEGYRCFTEKYHLKRGYCCQSGCKHCPWDFNKSKKKDLPQLQIRPMVLTKKQELSKSKPFSVIVCRFKLQAIN